ncbi:M23 family metallopeptidase [Paenibacillus sp. J5C_2022]|uniref:M23 family metallopeptidase n=1 Tax=Paenibacillus sp. J5C2022 TaxID=2977129 RepID=UPI0021D16DA2|nr:M23 family metallopeptidase [Paenibacillus sp. J5C2022]MCU6711097.1 M23 family metallopeptidase [Paenibacillus sp. J5C2022]
MGTRDDVKKRRQHKIESLTRQYADRTARVEAERPDEPDWERISHNGAFYREEDAIHKPIGMSATGYASKEKNRMLFDQAQGGKRERQSFEESEGRTGTSHSGARLVDPELEWKRNPNPWERWGEYSDRGGTQGRSVGLRDHYEPEPPYPQRGHHFRKQLVRKFAIAIVLFIAVWGIFQWQHPWTVKAQTVVKEALTEEIDFAAVAGWYKSVFAGAPSFIPIFKDSNNEAIGVDGKMKTTVVSPLEGGVLLRTFAELLNGIELAGDSGAQVVAAERGRVVMVSRAGDSVLLQHAGSRMTIYGKLGSSDVKVDDWVEAGDVIGVLREAPEEGHSPLYFAIKQDNQYVDPVGVIPLD